MMGSERLSLLFIIQTMTTFGSFDVRQEIVQLGQQQKMWTKEQAQVQVLTLVLTFQWCCQTLLSIWHIIGLAQPL